MRIEDLIGALASIGGHLCLFGVMIQLKLKGMTPQQIGMVDVLGKDGHHYFFGDQPNKPSTRESDLAPKPGPGRSQVPRRAGHAGDGARGNEADRRSSRHRRVWPARHDTRTAPAGDVAIRVGQA